MFNIQVCATVRSRRIVNGSVLLHCCGRTACYIYGVDRQVSKPPGVKQEALSEMCGGCHKLGSNLPSRLIMAEPPSFPQQQVPWSDWASSSSPKHTIFKSMHDLGEWHACPSDIRINEF